MDFKGNKAWMKVLMKQANCPPCLWVWTVSWRHLHPQRTRALGPPRTALQEHRVKANRPAAIMALWSQICIATHLDIKISISTLVLQKTNDLISAMLTLIYIYSYNSKSPPFLLLASSFFSNCSFQYCCRTARTMKSDKKPGARRAAMIGKLNYCTGQRWAH